MHPHPLSIIRSLALSPLWVAQIGTKAKSFRDNPILGNSVLNQWGLHVARRQLAYAMAHGRRLKLAPQVKSEDRSQFHELGYFLRRNALEAELFAALRREVQESRMPASELHQGGTITRRIGLDDRWLAHMPASRQFVKDRAIRSLIHYAASYGGEPTFAIQTILVDSSGGADDPQTMLHSDTFHSTAKMWLFLDNVTEGDAPFAYVPGSHRLTPERLAWEREQSICAARASDRMHSEGSFRVSESDLSALGLPPPLTMAVPANTLIVADTSGFHRRSISHGSTTRVELYATLRRSPFMPFIGGHLAALPPFAGRLTQLDTALQVALESLGLSQSPWRPVGRTGAYEPTKT